jgi:AcrR family transcriptional regulator
VSAPEKSRHSAPVDDTRRLQTRYRLLEIAARHIALHGFEGASLRKIAEDAGVTAAAIYRHYPGGKSELYEATLGLVSATVGSLVSDNSVANSPIDQLVSQCDMMWQFFDQYPNVAAMIVRENISGGTNGPSPYLDQHVQAIDLIRAYLSGAISRGEVAPINISAFLFWITSYITNFHGCIALRDATWQEQDIKNARGDFLGEVRNRLEHKSDNSQ